MMVHPYQVDPNFNNSFMDCRSFVQLPLYVEGIDSSINTNIMKNPHILLFHLAALENGRKPYIGTIKKKLGEIFSECYIKSFK